MYKVVTSGIRWASFGKYVGKAVADVWNEATKAQSAKLFQKVQPC